MMHVFEGSRLTLISTEHNKSAHFGGYIHLSKNIFIYFTRMSIKHLHQSCMKIMSRSVLSIITSRHVLVSR